MPSQTASGFPYPLPTEQAKEGAVAIKNLADAIEARIGGVAFWTIGGLKTTDVNGIVSWTALPLTQVYGAISAQTSINGQADVPDAHIHRCYVGGAVPANAVWVKVFKHDGTVVANTAIGINTMIWGRK